MSERRITICSNNDIRVYLTSITLYQISLEYFPKIYFSEIQLRYMLGLRNKGAGMTVVCASCGFKRGGRVSTPSPPPSWENVPQSGPAKNRNLCKLSGFSEISPYTPRVILTLETPALVFPTDGCA